MIFKNTLLRYFILIAIISCISACSDDENEPEIATFDDGLLMNGDFEAGAEFWLAGVETQPAPVVSVDGNTYYSVDITSPSTSEPYLVNLSQKLELISGSNYVLIFDAWSDRDRTIIAGVGRSKSNFASATETVQLTNEKSTYVLPLGPLSFGESDNRVLFDNNAQAGMVNIDNVSLLLDDGTGPDLVPPVIELNGSSVVYLALSDSFDDPGATASDNRDGDISDQIEVAGDAVDNSTIGEYTITYNVEDKAGNEAQEVKRLVIVSEDGTPANLAANGDFESGEAGWVFFDNGGSAQVDNGLSNGGGSNSAKIVAKGAGNPGIKQERIGVGVVKAGDVVQIEFDHIGSVEGEGGIFNVLLFVERAEGETGDPITHIFEPRPTLSTNWTTFTGTFTIPGNAVVSGGISFLIESVCGGAAGCQVSANVDNVVVSLNP